MNWLRRWMDELLLLAVVAFLFYLGYVTQQMHEEFKRECRARGGVPYIQAQGTSICAKPENVIDIR